MRESGAGNNGRIAFVRDADDFHAAETVPHSAARCHDHQFHPDPAGGKALQFSLNESLRRPFYSNDQEFE